MERLVIHSGYRLPTTVAFKEVVTIVQSTMAALHKLTPELYYWGAGNHQKRFTIIRYDDDAFFDKLQSMARFGKPLYQFQQLGPKKRIVDETTTDIWGFSFYLANEKGQSKGLSETAPVPKVTWGLRIKRHSLGMSLAISEEALHLLGGVAFVEQCYDLFKQLFNDKYLLVNADAGPNILFDGLSDESLKPFWEWRYEYGAKSSTWKWGGLRAEWMGYLRRPGLGEVMPETLPLFEYEKDPLNDSVSYRLTKEMPDSNNVGHKQKIFALQSALDTCLISDVMDETSSFEGPWGYHDDKYAAQITGAPLGVKYMVRCAEFDGYDVERKVLIFARLFYITIVPRLERVKQLIAEKDYSWMRLTYFSAYAYHQMTTLDYIQDKTPIEWHIGIKEHADVIACLFKEGLQIPEGRLKVIYTPYEGKWPQVGS